MVSSAAKPIPDATPMTRPSDGSRRPCRASSTNSSRIGTIIFADSSMSATNSIGSAPRPRSASYSRVPATTTPMTPPKKAATASAEAGTCQCPVRACAKVRNDSGTTVAPSSSSDGMKLGFWVRTRVRSTMT
jgi:hypothetical protein